MDLCSSAIAEPVNFHCVPKIGRMRHQRLGTRCYRVFLIAAEAVPHKVFHEFCCAGQTLHHTRSSLVVAQKWAQVRRIPHDPNSLPPNYSALETPPFQSASGWTVASWSECKLAWVVNSVRPPIQPVVWCFRLLSFRNVARLVVARTFRSLHVLI